MARFDIREISIFIDTNIPGKEIVTLKKSMLYQPSLKDTSTWNETPFFTYDAEYPESYLARLTYEKQMEFFFKKTEMTNLLHRYSKRVFHDPKSKAVEIDQQISGGQDSGTAEDKEELRRTTSEKNVMVMLRLMFPTKYPIVGNIFSSFHSVVTGENEIQLKWMDFLPGFLKTKLFEGMPDYSYLKIDGKTYTVTQVIWQNDIYNHKEYKELIKQFEELQRWKGLQLVKLNSNIEKKRLQFVKYYRDNPDKMDVFKRALKEGGGNSTFIDNLKDVVMKFSAASPQPTRAILSMIRFMATFETMVDDYRSTTDILNPGTTKELKEVFREMKPKLFDIQSDEYILETYLKKDGVNLDYKQDEKYRQKLEKEYQLYVKFVDNIRKFRSPLLESTNHFLQNSLDDFANNTEKYKGVFNFLMNPININTNPFTKQSSQTEDVLKEEQLYKNRMNTGVTIRPNASVGNSYYEIYVQMNLIGGEVNDENKSKIDCVYQGETLSDKLSRVLNSAIYHPWNINSVRIFFDMEKGAAIPDPAKQSPEDKAANLANVDSIDDSSQYSSSYSSSNNYDGGGGNRSNKSQRKKFIQRFTKKRSPNWESNPGSPVYKTGALPLSHSGK